MSEFSIYRRLSPALLWMIGSILCPTAARGADAAFSDDGFAIYDVSPNNNTLERVCDEEQSLTEVKIDLGGKRGCFNGITRSDQAGFYLVTCHGIWHWKPGDKAAESIHRAPQGVSFIDIACDTQSGQMLIMAYWEDSRGDHTAARLYCMENRSSRLTPVWLRHLTQPVDCAVFLPDHTLLFGTEGDLWHGLLCTEPPEQDRPDGRGELVSYRYAPLAERFNYNGTSAERGVQSVAASAGKAYVGMHRMHGSGSATFERLDLPTTGPKGMFSVPLKNAAKDTVIALQSVEIIDGGEGSCAALCGSADGKKIYYTDSSSGKWRHHLCEGDGEPEPMKIKRQPQDDESN